MIGRASSPFIDRGGEPLYRKEVAACHQQPRKLSLLATSGNFHCTHVASHNYSKGSRNGVAFLQSANPNIHLPPRTYSISNQLPAMNNMRMICIPTVYWLENGIDRSITLVNAREQLEQFPVPDGGSANPDSIKMCSATLPLYTNWRGRGVARVGILVQLKKSKPIGVNCPAFVTSLVFSENNAN